MQYMLYRKSDGYCINTIIWDGVSSINIYPDYEYALIPDDAMPIPSIGWWYLGNRFIEPSPYPSWTLNESYEWVAPTPIPDEIYPYLWNEETLSWDRFIMEELELEPIPE